MLTWRSAARWDLQLAADEIPVENHCCGGGAVVEAAKWYAETSQSVQIAAAWYDGFLDTVESLGKNPWLGGVAPENDHFEFELRELHYGSGERITHRALYRVREDIVEVLTIRHHAERPLEPDDLKST